MYKYTVKFLDWEGNRHDRVQVADSPEEARFYACMLAEEDHITVAANTLHVERLYNVSI